jgi:nitrogen-specific signal transduction histidine kinase
MIVNQDAIGVLAIQDYKSSDCYDVHDVQMLSIIAAQAAAAIRNARLLSAARRACEELWETQARLLETERLRGVTETVGALNHEINNPLAAIAGNAQLLLRRRQELGHDAIAKVQTILDETHRIQRVTGKMSTLIQATSMPYPGRSAILDIHHSISGDESTWSDTFDPLLPESRAS